jgi:RimJ/RimL family protein N-acetyltransferase
MSARPEGLPPEEAPSFPPPTPQLPFDGLRVEELLVRTPTLADVPAILPAFSDPAFAIPAGFPVLDERALREFMELLPGLAATGLQIPGLIEDESTGEILGGASLHHWDPFRRRIEVGYWLFPGARGRGVATRVTRALAAHAFSQGALRVEAVVRVGNAESERVLERAGFTREAVLRSFFPLHGGSDGTIFSLLPGES